MVACGCHDLRTIAREMHQDHVTLFIVDGRPSQVEPEVLPQIDTKIGLLIDSRARDDGFLSDVDGGTNSNEILAA
jgi:uncharacterized protein